MNSKKRDEIYQQFRQHIEAFNQDYRNLIQEMEKTDKNAAYHEEQFTAQNDYLWRAVDLVKEYHALLGNMPSNLNEDFSMVHLWIAKRDALQKRAAEFRTDITAGRE